LINTRCDWRGDHEINPAFLSEPLLLGRGVESEEDVVFLDLSRCCEFHGDLHSFPWGNYLIHWSLQVTRYLVSVDKAKYSVLWPSRLSGVFEEPGLREFLVRLNLDFISGVLFDEGCLVVGFLGPMVLALFDEGLLLLHFFIWFFLLVLGLERGFNLRRNWELIRLHSGSPNLQEGIRVFVLFLALLAEVDIRIHNALVPNSPDWESKADGAPHFVARSSCFLKNWILDLPSVLLY